jgi:integrase
MPISRISRQGARISTSHVCSQPLCQSSNRYIAVHCEYRKWLNILNYIFLPLEGARWIDHIGPEKSARFVARLLLQYRTIRSDPLKKALSALAIAALKPKDKPYYVGDAKQDGLRVRVAPDGGLTWNVTVRIKHAKLLSTSLGRCDPDGRSGLDLAAARDRAAAIVKAARQGVNLIAKERADRQAKENLIDVATLIGNYSADVANPNRKGGALKTAKEINRRLRRALSVRLQSPASQLSRRDIVALLDPVVIEFPREAEKRRQVIDAMFSWGVAKGYVESNPVEGLPSYGSSPPRDRVLSQDELRILWRWLEDGADNMPVDAVAVLKLQILTGARIGEISGMEVQEIWIENDRLLWTLPDARSKNKKSHTRPLIGKARTLIESRLEGSPKGALFRTIDRKRALRSDDIGLALNNRRRPISHFTTHDLRRTFVSALDELGVSLDTIAVTIGHRRGGFETRTLIKHYSRPNLDARIEDALVVWDRHIANLLRS